jgi:hypothetical protein
VDRREAGRKSFGEVKPKIHAALRDRSFSRLNHETMQKLFNDAEIVTVFGDGWHFDLPRGDQSK